MSWQQNIFELNTAKNSFGAAEWINGASNQAAYEFINQWPNWPVRVVILHGSAGVGKSHLAAIWHAQAEADWLAAVPEITPSRARLVFDGVDVWAEKLAQNSTQRAKAEQIWLHALNSATQRQGAVLMTARTPPANWAILLPDLASRLRAAQHITLAEPDEHLLAALYTKWFADRQLHVPASVIEWLVLNQPRQAGTAQAMVAAIDSYALQANRQITIALIEDYLEAMQQTTLF